MKRQGNLFEAIVSFENLERAFHRAARCRRFKSEILAFRHDLEGNLFALQRDLRAGVYRTGTYRTFEVHDPKRRTIHALPFRDRVLHHAVIAHVAPVLERTFIHDSYACRVGMGTHRAVARLTTFLRQARATWPEVFALKADIRQFFPSVHHRVVMRLLRRHIKCAPTLALLEEIVFSNGSRWEAASRGMPIGNLTSQWFCNLVLSQLDHFIKEELRVRHYLRYMDDFVLLAGSKDTLHGWRTRIEAFLGEYLHLELNAKTAVSPARLGVEFVGYRCWADRRVLRASSRRRMLRSWQGACRRYRLGEISAERLGASIQSWLAQLAHADGAALARRIGAGAFETQASPA
jgi:retron-type reverse transcriptase